MMKSQAVGSAPGRALAWQRWAPYAAVAWSLLYAALGITWAVGGRNFPFDPTSASDGMGPLLGRLGPAAAWAAVILAGLPAAALGAAMLRGVQNKVLRPLFIAAGVLLAGVLLLLMTGLDLLALVGYIPYTVVSLITGSGASRKILEAWAQWTMIHELLCLTGGFLWLAATVCYMRRSAGACLYCGRRDGPDGWQGPEQAARWGRIAVYVALGVPVFYALTRYSWALGIPLGMSEAYLRQGQAHGIWISGLFLATFGLVGAGLMLGLIQRWGEVFPRWMIGLRGRRVPLALALVPSALASVVFFVGGVGIWSDLGQMAANLASSGMEGAALFWGLFFQIGPTLLFPLWGVALAVAALGYYYRRRGACRLCGRGASSFEPATGRAKVRASIVEDGG